LTAPGTADAAQPPQQPDGQPGPRRVRRAAGIYGVIVTASVIATAGTTLKTVQLVVAIFVTLLVYWLAEEYAQIGEHASAGHLPTWPRIGAALAAKWPMVSASYIPLLTLLVARLFGATPPNAALVALIVCVGLLTFYGWAAARAAGLRGPALIGMTLAASAMGLLMVALKAVLPHLH
jgi:hypothetical protein